MRRLPMVGAIAFFAAFVVLAFHLNWIYIAEEMTQGRFLKECWPEVVVANACMMIGAVCAVWYDRPK